MGQDDVSEITLDSKALAIRAGARLSIPGMAIMTAVLVFVHIWFRPRVQTVLHLDLWVAFMGGTVVVWLAVILAFFLRQPDDSETVRRWGPLGHGIQVAQNLGIAASPWVLLPGSDAAFQYFTTMMFVWYIGVSAITSNAGAPVSRWEVAAMTLSSALFALSQDTPYRIPVALLVLLIGFSMIGLRGMVQKALLTAVSAQARSLRLEAETREALAVVAAERDLKTRFIAAASHDLQQPVAAAAMFFEAAVRAPEGPMRDRALEGARAAFRSTSTLLDSLLHHLRLEAGAEPVRIGPVDVDGLLQTILLRHQPAAADKAIGIRRSRARLQVQADEGLLERAIENLVANSIRHSGAARLFLGARRRGGGVELWVIDDGRGIPEAERNTVFERFATGQGGTAGFGLGLGSARQQVELMGGTLLLEPRWARGAAFVIRLPAAAGPDGDAQAAARAEARAA
jgi:signal transduction histidine kinase